MSRPAGEESEGAGWARLKRQLAALDFHPSRRLGQNFLRDENLARALVRDAGVAPESFVLEVGPGLGRLTAPLLEAGARVLAVEIDDRLATLLVEHLGSPPNLELIRADALAKKHLLAPEVAERLSGVGPWQLVANLPYKISAPLLAVLAELENPPWRMSVLVQREVAERICAEPGTSDWGPLTVVLQATHRTRWGRDVGPGAFWPRPKVESASVHLDRREDAPGREELGRIRERVAGLFQRRRQALGRVLGDLLGERARALALLEELRIDPSLRAETLPLETILALVRSPAWPVRT